MTETVKHTPGPWTVDGPADNQIVWSSPENRICFLAHSNGARPEEDFANGRLIALAPEIMEESKNLIALLERFHPNFAFNGHTDKLAKAISKAEARP